MSPSRASQPLHDQLVGLAATPDDSSRVPAGLTKIAELSAKLIAHVASASVTCGQPGAYRTVATSSEAAIVIDLAQYADEDGPCLKALQVGHPVAVPDIAATRAWPGFRVAATGLGIQASLSIPLSAGSGATIGALNLYSPDRASLTKLSTAVWFAYDRQNPIGPYLEGLDNGGRQLATGLADALATRDVVRQSLAQTPRAGNSSPDARYRSPARAPGSGPADDVPRPAPERHR